MQVKSLPAQSTKNIHNSQSNVVCIACSYHFMTTYWIHLAGFAANTYFSHSGGVDYQCMPLHTDYNSFSNSGYWSVISGVEFETGNAGLFSGSSQGQNVPCARCLIPRSAIMMYPAKRNCPHGWNKEYEGNIFSEPINIGQHCNSIFSLHMLVEFDGVSNGFWDWLNV